MQKLKIAAALAALLALLALHRAGALSAFTDPGELKRAIVNLGPWAQLAFVGSYTALQPFGIPGTVFVMAAPLIWPWPEAFALSMIGTMGASVLGFAFCRFVGRDWVRDKIPQRIRRYEAALEKRAFATVALLRFLFWMPQWLHAFFGLSKISFWSHFWGSLVGYAPPLFVMSFFGEKIFAILKELSAQAWIAVGVVLVVVAIAVWFTLRTRAARVQSPTA